MSRWPRIPRTFRNGPALPRVQTDAAARAVEVDHVYLWRLLHDAGIVRTLEQPGWVAELTFDRGLRGGKHDFRPDLPLIIRY